MELIFTDQNFEKDVLQSDVPVLVDFWAEWCPPCKIIAPVVEELAKEYEGKMKIGKLNVDENGQTSAKYSIMSIPTLLIFKKGQVVKTMVGAQSKDGFKRQLDEIIAS